MPTLNLNDIVRLTFLGSCFNQSIQNTVTYKVTNVAGPVQQQSDVFTDFDGVLAGLGNLYALYKLFLPTDWKAISNRYQVIKPTRYVAIDKSHVGESGGNLTNTETANVGATITRRGDFANRANISSFHLLATTDSTFLVDGKLTGLAITALSALAARLIFTQTVSGVGGTTDYEFTPVIYHPNVSPNTSTITSYIVQETVRVNRRRTLNIGI